ncbi:hypothetical protein cyc_08630 [Cyclospora cayetanensis]|uniref:Uncharacterized protein n=1 Tax=Cyclospora cayetanensis TaxID=88456 RepID=A0A1D3D668_9EIME|nr:hypothetical protein cyc_08630 [Cyclospora cayetanensis]
MPQTAASNPGGGISVFGGMMEGADKVAEPVVGELQGKPNAQLKSEMAEEFDFDAMNSKFEKPATLDDNAELLPQVTAYDKNVSFFDSISCEALSKRAGAQQQPDSPSAQDDKGRKAAVRQQNRALDVDTFGEGAAHYNPRHMNGRRGGRGRSNGRGGSSANRGGRSQPGAQRTWTQRAKQSEVGS